MKTKILVLCHGNLCRSPAAEKILRKTRPGLEVRSAGVMATPNRVIAAKMRAALEASGYESTGRSAIVTLEMVSWADLILVMELKHAHRLAERLGHEVRAKVRHVGDLLGLTKIPDPHFSPLEVHYGTIKLLEQAFSKPIFEEWLR